MRRLNRRSAVSWAARSLHQEAAAPAARATYRRHRDHAQHDESRRIASTDTTVDLLGCGFRTGINAALTARGIRAVGADRRKSWIIAGRFDGLPGGRPVVARQPRAPRDAFSMTHANAPALSGLRWSATTAPARKVRLRSVKISRRQSNCCADTTPMRAVLGPRMLRPVAPEEPGGQRGQAYLRVPPLNTKRSLARPPQPAAGSGVAEVTVPMPTTGARLPDG